MRKLTFVLAMSAMSFFAQAQSFKSVKVDFASGYAIPAGEGAKGGIVLAMEPKYSLNDKLTFGLRLEAALMAQVEVDQTTGELKSGSVKALAAYSATGDYFFSANNFRPFGGIGAGLFTVAGVSADASGSGEASGGQKFGFTPRAGFEIGHFRAALEYNFVGKTGTYSNNYMSIKLGFFAGGGRRSRG